MVNKGFTHLHLHSQYSLLDGAITFPRLLKRCSELGMDCVAVTDHGNLFGLIEFYTKALAAEIKPIIGIEAYVAPGSRHDKSKCSISDAAYHLILLAENQTGYQNLLKLATTGFTEGFYYRPRIDKEILAELNEGIIATSACIKGELATAFARGDEPAAYAAAGQYVKMFGPDRFFIEIQKHEGDDPAVSQGLIDLSRKMGLGLVVTNDAHFLTEDDHEAHNCLCAISTGKLANDPDRLIYPSDVYLKSPQEMRELFPQCEEAADNTLAIARRCNVEIDLKTRHAPVFRPPDDVTAEDYLTRLCYEGAERLYGAVSDEIKARLDRELEVIESKGFASYFLIVWDFCKYARDRGIALGARGSGVGTLVGYCLGLCNVDPIRYNLLFERFMDPQRNEMPDIDIDICQTHRPEVIDYVRRKYGHVAQIITFGTMKARAVIRDICRVMGVPLSDADRLAKLVPAALNMTLDEALETEPQLRQEYEQNPLTAKVIDIGRRLEGLARHASVHAAGVVVADEPLTNFIPLYKAPGSEDLVTQYEGPTVEKVGLLKMDFLGLKTLSVLDQACRLVKDRHGVEIDLDALGLHDKKVFDLFAAGRTKGIFQFESGGMQGMLMKMRPDRLEDLIAANALYRPGPMTLIPDYIDRKHGGKWSVPHTIMEEILRETYGIMVYQEQVMQICNRLGDIGLRDAYKLIKAISKKKADTIAKEREKFIAGCVDKGLKKQQAQDIFELIERFAGYGFNKSHSTRYSFVAYQTAYMKAHWPVEYMAALLTFEMADTDKLVEYINECTEMGIKVLAPDINESGVHFTPLNRRHGDQEQSVIRFGLAAVKGVGERAVEQIIAAREKVGRFQSLFHFCENVDMRAVNKQVLEALIKAGAFDRLGGNRAQMMAGLEPAMQVGTSAQSDKSSGQMSLFGAAAADTEYADDIKRLPNVPPWPEAMMLKYEKDVLGFYVTSNPLSHHAETISIYSTRNTSQLEGGRQDEEITIGGMIAKIRTHLTKQGRNAGAKMAVLTLEDLQGQTEVVLFPRVLEASGEAVVQDTVVFVRGRLDYRRERPNIIADEIIPLEQVREKLAGRVRIDLDAEQVTAEKVATLKSLCQTHRGRCPIFVTVHTHRGRVVAGADRKYAVSPSDEFCRRMTQLVGKENFHVGR